MSKYPMVRLADAFSLQMGKTPSRDCSLYWENGTNKWLSISDINKDSKFISETKEYITDKAVLESGIKHVPENTVIMSFKLSIGKTAITTCPIYTNEAIMAFIPKEEVSFDISFLYHLFANKNWSNGSNKAVKGSTLNKASLSITQIPYPTKEEQKRISKNLDKIFYLIQRRKQQLSKFDELAKSRFLEMFGDVVNNSKNLEISTLGRECVIVSGGTPSTGNEEYWNGNIKWITPAEIDEIDYIIFDTVRHITDKGKSAAHLELMPKGTVLLSSRAPIGKLAITGSEMTCNQGFKNLIPKDRITPIFLYYYLKGIIPEIQSLGRGATFKEVSKSIVANIKILVPSKREQIAFNSFIEQLDKSKFRIKKSLEKLELTYKALLQEYFG